MRIKPLTALLGLVLLSGLAFADSRGSVPLTFTVNSVADAPDLAPDGVCDAGGASRSARCAPQSRNRTPIQAAT